MVVENQMAGNLDSEKYNYPLDSLYTTWQGHSPCNPDKEEEALIGFMTRHQRKGWQSSFADSQAVTNYLVDSQHDAGTK
jgi:hypothetical protein